MKFSDLYGEAILWTCYHENFPFIYRILESYRIDKNYIPVFDRLGRFFPFDEFYVRGAKPDIRNAICDLTLSRKALLLPWMYRSTRPDETLKGKLLICPSYEMSRLLYNKIATKAIFGKLGLPVPQWSFPDKGRTMLEKPIKNSGGGIGIRLTSEGPAAGCFLEEYIPGCRSIGMQFFIFDEVDYLCADEMIYECGEQPTFRFHAQSNVQKDELPEALIEECLTLCTYLMGLGYRGLVGIDALVGEGKHYFLEVNPRGIAFLPAFFAGSSMGWTHFITYMKDGAVDENEFVLLDFGRKKKVLRKLQKGNAGVGSGSVEATTKHLDKTERRTKDKGGGGFY